LRAAPSGTAPATTSTPAGSSRTRSGRAATSPRAPAVGSQHLVDERVVGDLVAGPGARAVQVDQADGVASSSARSRRAAPDAAGAVSPSRSAVAISTPVASASMASRHPASAAPEQPAATRGGQLRVRDRHAPGSAPTISASAVAARTACGCRNRHRKP
jgi:hypothetical protein